MHISICLGLAGWGIPVNAQHQSWYYLPVHSFAFICSAPKSSRLMASLYPSSAETSRPFLQETSTGEDLDLAVFTSEPLEEPLELTGHFCATIWMSSSSTDADIFVAIRVVDGSREVQYRMPSTPCLTVLTMYKAAESHQPNVSADSQLYLHDPLEQLQPAWRQAAQPLLPEADQM